MSDILPLFFLGLLIVALVLAFYSPVMLYMFIINKKQRKYIGMVAKKYNLEFEPGTKKIVRDFPIAKGYYKGRWTYAQATSSGQASHNLRTGKTDYGTAHINVGVGVAGMIFTEMSMNMIKELEKGQNISLADFDTYFEIKVSPEQYKNVLFTDDVKKDIVELAKNGKYLSLSYGNSYLVSFVGKELIKEERYEEVIAKIELLHKIANNVPREGSK